MYVPMITEELFYRVQAILDGRNRQVPVLGRRNLDNDDFPLRRIVKCSACGSSFTGAWSKGQMRRYGYYSAFSVAEPVSLFRWLLSTALGRRSWHDLVLRSKRLK